MICPICGCTLTFRYFPKGAWICPVCGTEQDSDDVRDDHDE